MAVGERSEKCECGAAAPTTSKDRGRFWRRHGSPCPSKAKRDRVHRGTIENACGVRSVVDDDDAPDVASLNFDRGRP
jgi:hypothetical protein